MPNTNLTIRHIGWFRRTYYRLIGESQHFVQVRMTDILIEQALSNEMRLNVLLSEMVEGYKWESGSVPDRVNISIRIDW